MATAPELVIPVPTYPLGTIVYVAATESTTEKLPCPDCLGSGRWIAKSPAGQEFTLGCPRCGQYTYHDLPRLQIRKHVANVRELSITGYEINHEGKIEYKATPIGSSGGWYSLTEDKIVTDRAKAQADADAKALLANADEEQTVEAIAARHFGSMKLDNAQFDQHKNGLWSAHYHAANIAALVRDALYGKEDASDDDDPQDTDKAIEDLREAVRWSSDYHLDSMPFAGLIRAATQSDDPAVAKALAKMPEPMVSLFTVGLKPPVEASDLAF